MTNPETGCVIHARIPEKVSDTGHKRHLARRFYRLLAEPPATQPPAANGKPTTETDLATIAERPRPARNVQEIQAAPSRMVCVS